MTWYDELYVGESIVHKTKRVKWKINHNAGQIGIYVIAPASNDKNLLDIIPAAELLQRGYPTKDLKIAGLAGSSDEALEVAVSIVDEVDRNTGAFLVRSYLDEHRSGREG